MKLMQSDDKSYFLSRRGGVGNDRIAHGTLPVVRERTSPGAYRKALQARHHAGRPRAERLAESRWTYIPITEMGRERRTDWPASAYCQEQHGSSTMLRGHW